MIYHYFLRLYTFGIVFTVISQSKIELKEIKKKKKKKPRERRQKKNLYKIEERIQDDQLDLFARSLSIFYNTPPLYRILISMRLLTLGKKNFAKKF